MKMMKENNIRKISGKERKIKGRQGYLGNMPGNDI